MSDEQKPSRLRGIFKNAVIWATGWGLLGSAVASVMRLADGIPFFGALVDGVGMGIRIGVMGGIVGAAFAAFISVAYRGRNLSNINWLKFGIGGAVLAGIFVPTFLEAASVLSGGGLVPWNLIDGDMLMAAVFGGITAAGTMKIAQLGAETNPPTEPNMLDRTEPQSLGAGEAAEYHQATKARAATTRS